MEKFDLTATHVIKDHLVSGLGRNLTEIENKAFSMPRSGIAYEMIDNYITDESKSVQDVEHYVREVVDEYQALISDAHSDIEKNKVQAVLLHLKEKPYHLFAIVAVLFFVASFFKKAEALDLNMHDSYFIIANVSLYRIFAVVLLFIWSVYQIISGYKLWSNKLTWLHVVFTIVPMVFFAAQLWRIFTFESSLDGIPKRYYALSEFQKKPSFVSIEFICVVILAILLLGQVLFLINIIAKKRLAVQNK